MAKKEKKVEAPVVETPAAEEKKRSKGFLALMGTLVVTGGALAIAVANRVLMMEYSVYSVIYPEECAAILWADDTKGPEAAEALKLTAQDIEALGDVIDGVIPEPAGGAHNDPEATAALVKKALLQHLKELSHLSGEELIQQRFNKFRAMTRMASLPA